MYESDRDCRVNREQVRSLLGYLNAVLGSGNLLHEARIRNPILQTSADSFTDVRCSCCGMPFSSASREIMADGRVRCPRCQKTGLETTVELVRLYESCRDRFEQLFSLRLPEGIHVQMKTAAQMKRETGFVPAPGQAGSISLDETGYTIWLDYGISSLAIMQMLAMFFTAIWQNEHWDPDALLRALGAGTRPDAARLKAALEQGMALWASVQFLLYCGETEYASLTDSIAGQDSLQGTAYREFCREYPWQYAGRRPAIHPFHEQMPIHTDRLMGLHK